ncbi:MAG: prepilin-type N-terminal cleavage/methylation domain-containing protein [Parafilimonas terrae]|nr:prepilin-type N-terminal cleavage/methylation domain-containing protein [Parafilimonas terrae]
MPAARSRNGAQGYALIELILALLIASLLAGLALPWVRRGGGASETQALAQRMAVLLRADRNAALREGRAVVSRIDAGAGSVRSGSSSSAILLPPRWVIRSTASLERGVRFDPDGRAQSGEILLLSPEAKGVILRIDAMSAAVEIRDSGGRHGE